MSTILRPWFVLFLPFVLLACETSRSDKPSPPASSAAPAAVTSAPASVPSGKTSSAAPPPSASAAPGEAETNLKGTYEGRYEAKRGEVEIPPKVKDKVRAKDDGKTAAGAGKISITIDASGEVTGKVEGALGAATLKGRAEGEDISASFHPDEGQGALAMYGVVAGKLEKGHIKGKIRVANGDASVVREAEIDLASK